MKKIFFAMVAVCAMLFSACSNDDIEITKVGRTHELTVNVAMQGMYDKFGITQNIRDLIRKDNCSLGVTVFLYNAEGNLIDSKVEKMKAINTVPISFGEQEDGTYTVVLVETVFANDKMLSWEFDKQDKLSTLNIKQNSIKMYWYQALGTASATVVVGGNSQIPTVTPSAIGSLIDIYYYNVNETDYVKVGLGTTDVIDSYKLDPSLSREERFFTDVTTSGYFNLRGYCDNGTDSEMQMTLYVLESSIQYRYYAQEAEDEGTTTWTRIGNDKIVRLNDGARYYGGMVCLKNTNSGNNNNFTYYTASLFDSYDKLTSWVEQVNSKLGSQSPVVPDLYTTWKGSVSDVQKFMKGYNMTIGMDGRGEDCETGFTVQYEGKGRESNIAYFFTSRDTGLFEVDVFYNNKNISRDEAINYLKSEYDILSSDVDGMVLFLSKDKKTYAIYQSVNDDMSGIAFADADYINSDSKTLASLPARLGERLKKTYASLRTLK